MRLLALAALAAAFAGSAEAQVFAIDQRVPLKIVGDTDDLVALVQIPAPGQAPAGGTFDGWAWTFMRQMQGQGDARWNTVAVLTRYDCRAGTRQRMRYEFYVGEMAMNDTAYEEAPSQPTPGSIEAQSLSTVCDPAFNPDQGVVNNGARGVRRVVDEFWAGS